MFEDIRTHWKVYQLQRSMDRAYAAFLKAQKKHKAGKATLEEVGEAHGEAYGVSMDADETIMLLLTEHYKRTAYRLLLPIPEFDYDEENDDDSTNWTRGMDGAYHLSVRGLHALRSEIRREKKERREVWFRVLAAATGIIGALIGLVSVL